MRSRSSSHNPRLAFLALGAVVLAVTGTEALYADMGHFGAAPIRRAWLCFVMPALVLNYFGQGALLLADPAAIKNPFYLLAPQWALIPLVVLATCAAVIASQAVISGAFSLTRAAIQMGYCPRLKILHTSERQIGQIYVPFINWTLLIAVVLLVVGFRELRQPRRRLRHRRDARDADRLDADLRRDAPHLGLVAAGRASPSRCRSSLIDLAFLASNALKIPAGGWFPLLIGAVVFTLLTTWKRGRALLMDAARPRIRCRSTLFIESIEREPAGARARDRGLPDVDRRSRAARAAAQPEAQQGAARARRLPDDPSRGLSARARRRARARQPISAARSAQMDAYYGFAEDPDVPELLETDAARTASSST